MAEIKIHYDGDIALEHSVSMRTLAKTISHMQAAIGRAHLDIKYDKGVYKHAHLTGDDYIETDFFVQAPQEGGYIFSCIRDSINANKILDRIAIALNPLVEKAIAGCDENSRSIKQSVQNRKNQVYSGIIEAQKFEYKLGEPDELIKRKYGDRSIAKEIDGIIGVLRPDHAGDSSCELTFKSDKRYDFKFNRRTSQNFHKIVSERKLGDPLIYEAELLSLDRNQGWKGKFRNLYNNKVAYLHLSSEEDFRKVHPFLPEKAGKMVFIGSPLIEYDAYDPNAGDVYFLDIASN